MNRLAVASLRARLLALVLLALLPALGVLLLAAWEQRRLAIVEALENARRLVRAAASNQDRLILGGRQLLVVLLQLPQVLGGHPGACSALLKSLLKQPPPLYINLAAIRPNGDLFCSALPPRGPINVADRSYFQRAIQKRDFVVGEYQIDRITGKAAPILAHPVVDRAGRIQAVLLAALDLSALYRLAAETELPGDAVITVVDRRSTVLVRYPDSERWVGHTLPEAPVVKAMLSQQSEGTAEAVGVDGITRLYAFTPLRDAPEAGMYVSIGVSKEAAFAGARRLLARNLTVLALVALLAMGAAWVGADLFVLRQVKTLVSTTKRLSGGDLNARTGLGHGEGELGQLAQAFDEMGAALETRQAEAGQAENEIRRLNEQLEQRVLARTAELEAANKELEAFSYSVSHDLRAPLRHIGGFADLLQRHAPEALDEKSRRYVKTISESAKQMGNLIDDLLVFSQMGRADLHKTPVNLDQLVKNLLQDLEEQTRGRQIVWRVGPLPEVYGDPAMLRQALINLISNAVKYTRPRVQVQIELGAASNEREAIVFIRDNGVGFDMRYADRLFGVFQRLHSSAEFEGTGIGLANVRRIIHRHGGRTWAEGSVDGGATFYFSLPHRGKDTV